MKLALLDYSGTLVNDAAPVYHTNNIMLSRRGLAAISFEEWKAKSQGSPAEFLEVFEGRKYTPQEAVDANQEYFEIYQQIQDTIPATAFDGVGEALIKLNMKMPTVVISTTPLESIQHYSAKFHFPQFNTIHAKTHARPKVNKVELIAESLRDLQVTRFDAIYIGDTVNDMRLAKQAGVATAAVAWGYHTADRLAKENPTHGVHATFPNLVDMLLKD